MFLISRCKVLMLAVGLLCGVSALAATVTIDGREWSYNVASGTASIAGVSPSDGNVEIPSSVGGYAVTIIGHFAFKDCSGLTSVTIPSSVTNIGMYAFYGCSGLTSVEIPSSVTNIGMCAFSGCSGLTSVTIPSSVTSIERYAFEECGNLRAVHIADLAAWCRISFGDNPLKYAHNLYLNGELVTSLEIPDGVAGVGDYAFSGCNGLASVTMPPSVTSIGKEAFRGCSGVTSLAIPNGVTNIGNWAFADCGGMVSVTMPSNLQTIGVYAFDECDALEKMVFAGDAPADVGEHAFPSNAVVFVKAESTGWDVEIPGTWRGMPIRYAGALTGEEVFVSGRSVVYDGWAHGVNTTLPEGAAGAMVEYATSADGPFSPRSPMRVDAGTLTVWCRATLLGVSTATNMAVVTISKRPITFTSGSASKEYDGTVLTCHEVSVGGDGFAMGEGATYAFMGSQTEVGSSVNTFTYTLDAGTKAANYDIAIEYGTLSVTDHSWEYDVNADGTITLTRPPDKAGVVTIPSEIGGRRVVALGEDLFWGCDGLTSVTIPSSVTNVGDNAFFGCMGLETITLPSRVTSVGSYAFSSCTRLKSITLPSRVSAIGEGVFSGCTGLKSVTLPSRVTSVADSLFSGCTSLASVSIPSGVTVIGSDAFSGCEALTAIAIPSGVTEIGEYAFSGCTGLVAVDLPSGLTEIAPSVFLDCTSLASVSIPSGVEAVGEGAFEGCSALEEIVFAGNAPAEVGGWAFPSSATIYVSRGSTGWDVDIPGAWMGCAIEYSAPALPTVADDADATVTGDAEAGYVVTPGAGNGNVVVEIPDGVSAEKVTVVVSPDVSTVRPNGATVKVARNGHDVTAFLDVPVAVDGVVDISSATVKREYAEEPLDVSKGAEIALGDSSSPSLKTAPTRKGLVYTLREGATLDAMKDGATTVGDGQPWTPAITVKGGASGFYSIRVD